MKNLLIIIAAVVLASCTEQARTRRFGGKMTISLPKGEKLIMATWKENNLFTLTEPMDSGYIPKTKTFKESSSWGVMESEIKFIENK